METKRKMKEIVVTNKPNLIKWLSSDSIILQHVQANGFITTPEYEDLMSITNSRDRTIKLLDLIIKKGSNTCRDFLNLLKNDDVNEFSPDLRKWIQTVDTSETANMTGQPHIQVTKTITASDGSNVFSPTITGTQTGSISMNMNNLSGRSCISADCQKPKEDSERKTDWEKKKGKDWERREIQDYMNFLRNNTSQLVQKVKNIDPILDDLVLHNESKANVRAEKTDQQKMRKLLEFVNCESIAKKLVDALFEHEGSLMIELRY